MAKRNEEPIEAINNANCFDDIEPEDCSENCAECDWALSHDVYFEPDDVGYNDDDDDEDDDEEDDDYEEMEFDNDDDDDWDEDEYEMDE